VRRVEDSRKKRKEEGTLQGWIGREVRACSGSGGGVGWMIVLEEKGKGAGGWGGERGG